MDEYVFVFPSKRGAPPITLLDYRGTHSTQYFPWFQRVEFRKDNDPPAFGDAAGFRVKQCTGRMQRDPLCAVLSMVPTGGV